MSPDDLVEIELIKQLKYRYMRCVDRKLWTELRECFTEEARCAYSAGKYSYQGREPICRWLEDSMSAPSFHSSHRVHHPEISLLSPSRAKGIWALEDTVIETALDFSLRGAAFYDDVYVKSTAGWQIEYTGYVRTFEEMHARKSVAGLTLTASEWSSGGRSKIDA
jgi:hypothetical protein